MIGQMCGTHDKPEAILILDVADGPPTVERHARPPACALAEPLPALAHRDLLRRQDEPDRLLGILGIYVEGTLRANPVLEMDGADGWLRAG